MVILRATYLSGYPTILVILFIFKQTTGIAQTFSTPAAPLPTPTFSSWLQKAVADMNADGKDDIIRADREGKFYVLHQQANGSFSEMPLGNVQPATPLSVVVADLDNNGYNDILTGGQYNGVRIIKANYNGSGYNIKRLPQDSIFTQASTLADINNDGWIDAFVCNDDSTNAIWRNTGNGNFVRDTEIFDFSSVPLNKHAGNYGIVFSDINNDGRLEAYLSKCRAGVYDSTDQRRINQLFSPNPSAIGKGGIYSPIQGGNGLADSSQTWVTEFQDIDNDGDMDAFIANHYAPSRLMLNNGTGYFTDITAAAGLLGTVPDGILQALMRDFDNDGYMDLIVSGMMQAKYFRNNGNRTFTAVALPLLNKDADSPLRSFAIGDLNHDGFLDLYGSYFWGDFADTDQLWLNDKNANHFLAITLTGTQSNRSAVGARITLTANGKTYIREVRAGESYGISNTLTQHIGLGTTTQINRVEVRWPSGQVSTLLSPQIDQFVSLTEPTCSKLCVPITTKIMNIN